MSSIEYQSEASPVKGVSPQTKTSYRTKQPESIGRAHTQRIALRHRVLQEVENRMAQEQHLLAERWEAIRLGTETTNTSHWVIARLNEIQHLGQIDRKGGIYHIYEGPVGKGVARENMHAQITEYQGDLCISFWTRDGRCRRLLVTTTGKVWIALGIRAIVHTGKYLDAFHNILAVRVTRETAGEGGCR